MTTLTDKMGNNFVTLVFNVKIWEDNIAAQNPRPKESTSQARSTIMMLSNKLFKSMTGM